MFSLVLVKFLFRFILRPRIIALHHYIVKKAHREWAEAIDVLHFCCITLLDAGS